MPGVNAVPLVSYLNCNPKAVHKTSEGRGWLGLTVNLDYFEPFSREALRYSEHHVCINVGRGPAKLTYAWEDGYRLRTIEKLIRPGEFLVTPAEQPVRWCLHDNATALSIRLHTEFVKRIAEASMNMNPDRVELFHRIAAHDGRIRSLGWGLRDELLIGGLGDRLCAESAANQLAVHLLRHYSVRQPKGAGRREGLSSRVVREVVGNIKDNLSNPSFLSLRSQAQEFGLSDSQLSRWFQQSEGVQFTTFVEDQRGELAKRRLLECLEKSVQEISVELGFRTSGHFCRFFKRVTGRTPTEFRNDAL